MVCNFVDSGVTTPDAPSIAATGCSVGTKQGFSIMQQVVVVEILLMDWEKFQNLL